MTRTDPATTTITAPRQTGSATSAFSRSVVVSGIRCLLAYIVFPWLLPLFGIVNGVGAVVGLILSAVAIGFNIASIRRFSRSQISWRWAVMTINAIVIVLLVVLIGIDVAALA